MIVLDQQQSLCVVFGESSGFVAVKLLFISKLGLSLLRHILV